MVTEKCRKFASVFLSILLVVTFLPLPVGERALADQDSVTSGETVLGGEDAPDTDAPLLVISGDEADLDTYATSDTIADTAEILLAPRVDIDVPTIGLPESNIRTVTWSAGSSGTVIGADGKTLDLTPPGTEASVPSSINSSRPAYVTAQIDFSNSAGAGYGIGDVEIRLPQHIYFDRDGNPVDTFTTGLPLAPAVAEDRSFNYRLEDTDGDGKTDTVVLVNCKPITGEIKFQALVSYNYQPARVADGYQADLEVEFRVKEADDTTSVSTSAISATNHTSARFTGAGKSMYAKYDTWQDAWGEKPADADDYFYVLWQGINNVNRSATQPYAITYEEQADADVVKVFVAQKRYSSSSYDASSYRPNYTSRMEYDENGNGYVAGSPTRYQVPSENATYSSYSQYILCRYKKSDFKGGDRISNTLTMHLIGQDGCSDTREASASFVYYPDDEKPYPGDRFSGSKFWQSGTWARAMTSLVAGRSVTFGVYCFNNVDMQYYSLTKEGDKYGRRDYTVEVIDEQLYFGDAAYTGLEKGDYSLTIIEANGTAYDKAATDNTATATTITPTVYVKSDAGDEWHVYDKDADTGIYAAKASYTGRDYSVKLRLVVQVTIRSTETTRAQAQKLLDAGKTEMKIVNVNTISVKDDQGKYVSFSRQSLYNSQIANQVYADDAEQFAGVNQLHYYAQQSIKEYTTSMSAQKSVDSKRTTWNSVTQCQEIGYTLAISSGRLFDMVLASDPEEVAKVANSEEYSYFNKETFYDLLPLGSSLMDGTLAVRTEKRTLDASEYVVETVENWEDTGRTMLMVHVDIGTETYGDNWSQSSNSLRSNVYVDFTLLYPLDSLYDYGTTVKNSFAVRSGDGPWAKGTNDAGKDGLYADLDRSGEVGDVENEFLYSGPVTNTFNVHASTETGYTKSVRSFETSAQIYASEAEAVAGGRYEYRLRYASDPAKGTSRNIVMYDILEADYGDNAYWKGTFESVDLSQAKSLGIAPVVYYSTLALSSADEDKGTWQNLTDTEVWSTQAPEDLSSVTAIAIDFSKKTDGTEFALSPGSGLTAKIVMRAPLAVDELVDPAVYAYNMPWISRTTSGEDDIDSTTNIDKGNLTKVSVKPPVELHKTSEVPSGTSDDPAKVKLGERLTYTLEVTNTSAVNALSDVVIVDAIPEGLTIDEENITVKADEGEAVTMLEYENADLSVNGQTVSVTVTELAAGATLQFLIPVTAIAQATYENTAEITSIEGIRVSYPSETTYHEPETTTILATKVWAGESALTDIRPSAEDFAKLLTLYNGDEVATRADGTTYEASVSDNGDNTYTIIYKDLPVYMDELTPDWRIVEAEVSGYKQDDASKDGVGPDGMITNTYSPVPVEAEASITKVLKGRDWLESDTFTFQLTAVTEDAPMPAETEVIATRDEGSVTTGTATFGSFKFTMPGTYTYEVRELATGIKDMKDSDNVATITFEVTDDGEGNLEAAVTVDSAIFENVYEPKKIPGTSDPASNKAFALACIALASLGMALRIGRKQIIC